MQADKRSSSEERRNGYRREADKVVFKMVHDLEKAAPYLQEVQEHLDSMEKHCKACEPFKKVIEIMNGVMRNGCSQIRRTFDE